jgi:hypothetical protein
MERVRRWTRLRKKSWVRPGCVACLYLVFGSRVGCAWDDTMILGKDGVVEYPVFFLRRLFHARQSSSLFLILVRPTHQ